MKPTQKTEALALIRERCVAANPEITELKFGCMIEVNYGGIPFFFQILGRNATGNYLVNTGSDQLITTTIRASRISDVIGRSVRLADVMLALDKTRIMDGFMYLVGTHGVFISYEVGGDILKTNGYWNLRSDSLDDQSDETLLFLANLLK